MKQSWFITMLLGSAAMPYLFSSKSDSTAPEEPAADVHSVDPSSPDPAAALSHDALAAHPAHAAGASSPHVGAGLNAALPHGAPVVVRRLDGAPLEGAVYRLEEILSFGVTVPWITARWQRVSTGMSELDLHGYRVPLVTGTSETDLAGSLTYYFDAKQSLESITFQGMTGNPSGLVAYLASQFKFARETDPDPSLHIYRRREFGRVKGELKIEPTHIIRADAPHERYAVSLTIDRPG